MITLCFISSSLITCWTHFIGSFSHKSGTCSLLYVWQLLVSQSGQMFQCWPPFLVCQQVMSLSLGHPEQHKLLDGPNLHLRVAQNLCGVLSVPASKVCSLFLSEMTEESLVHIIQTFFHIHPHIPTRYNHIQAMYLIYKTPYQVKGPNPSQDMVSMCKIQLQIWTFLKIELCCQSAMWMAIGYTRWSQDASSKVENPHVGWRYNSWPTYRWLYWFRGSSFQTTTKSTVRNRNSHCPPSSDNTSTFGLSCTCVVCLHLYCYSSTLFWYVRLMYYLALFFHSDVVMDP
jgi:hypothetical protein